MIIKNMIKYSFKLLFAGRVKRFEKELIGLEKKSELLKREMKKKSLPFSQVQRLSFKAILNYYLIHNRKGFIKKWKT